MKTKSVAVIGTGYWGKNLVRNFHSLGVLTAICDTQQAALDRMAELAPGIRSTTDFAAILNDPSIEAVALATPAAQHYVMALAALNAGKHVLVEKPLALRADSGRELVELAEAKGLTLLVGHLLRYHPAVRELSRHIREGKLGQLRYLYSNRLNFGKLRDEENSLWSFAPHDISLILHFVGQQPIRVHAEGGNYLNAHVADVTITHLEFRDGVRAHIHVSWLHPYKDQRLVVIGEQGMIVFDDQQPWDQKLAFYPHEVEWIDRRPVAQKGTPTYLPVTQEEPLRNQCAHFVECFSSGATPITDGREGLAVLEVLQAAQEALDGPNASKNAAIELPKGAAIHPTAVVDGPVKIGAGTKIWHFSKLMGPLTIGEHCSLGQNVVVERGCTLGNNVKIQNNVSVYSGVILEDDVFCGPAMVFTNVGTPRSGYPRRGQYVTTLVRRGASIGANATIVCGNTLGTYCFVGAGAVVTRDVPDYGLVYGNPARLHGWACFCGATLPLDVDEASQAGACPDCGRDYIREGHRVSPVEEAS